MSTEHTLMDYMGYFFFISFSVVLIEIAKTTLKSEITKITLLPCENAAIGTYHVPKPQQV